MAVIQPAVPSKPGFLCCPWCASDVDVRENEGGDLVTCAECANQSELHHTNVDVDPIRIWLVRSGDYGALREQVRTLTNERDTLNEKLQTTHRHVAEVARLLDPEAVPDAWGLHAAAQKRIEEVRTLAAERDEALAESEEVEARERATARRNSEEIQDLRARVAELEMAAECKKTEALLLAAERDAAQQRAKRLEDALREVGHGIVLGTKEAREAAVATALKALAMNTEAP